MLYRHARRTNIYRADMHITPFAVEQWMNAWETRCTYNLAETCAASITTKELLTLAGRNHTDLSDLLPVQLTYGVIEGSDRLRAAIAALYGAVDPETITVTHGTIGANMLVYRALTGPGTRVVSIVPTYQQHTAIPQSLGAQVQTLTLSPKAGFLPDLDRLRTLMDPGTTLLTLTNPNNPTGALIPPAMLEQIAEIARSAGAYILADEVYRGTGQTGDGLGPSITSVYEKGISTASVSKAFSLAGLRTGWVIAPPEVTAQIRVHRDYDTISVGRLNDHLAAIALEAADTILARSHRITRGNLAHLAEWIETQPRVNWIRPEAGTTAMLRMNVPMTDRAFALDLLAQTGVMLTPGDCFAMPGHVRIGFANDPDALRAGLAKMAGYLAKLPH